MTAHSDALVDRANALRRTLQDRLGKTLALAGGLSALAQLNTALEDDVAAHPKDDHSGQAGQAGPSHPISEPASGADPTLASGVVIERARRVVIHHPPPSRDDRPEPSPKPAPPRTEAQRREAIRRAVCDLNDHWRLKDARIAEIDAAHRELSAGKS